METIWQTLLATPWWVYLLLAYLIKIGLRASTTQVVSIKKLFVIPILFAAMSLHTLLTSFPIGVMSISSYTVAILVGVGLGYWQLARLTFQVDKQHGLLKLPGTWSTLVIILIIFCTKYYFGYEMSVDPSLLQQTSFELSMLLVSGVCTGLFIGRLLCALYRLQSREQVDLTAG